MAQLNYKQRLQNLQTRKFDPLSNFTGVSESFSKSTLAENVKYLIESMRPIGSKYNAATIQASENVMGHLEKGLNVSFDRDYRKQGSVTTDTNIKLYSDIDLLAIVGDYYYLAPALQPAQFPYTGDSNYDIKEFRRQATSILKQQYDDVDTTGKKSISIYNKNLRRKVDVVFSFWYNTQGYVTNKDEYYRGVYLFDFTTDRKILDFPFAHIRNVNAKGSSTVDGSKKGIRLLKSLKIDSDQKINLSSFQLTTIVHGMQNAELIYYKGREIDIAEAISTELSRLISDGVYRKFVKSPNSIEFPLQDDSCVVEMRKLKIDLDQLISDCRSEFSGYFSKQQILSY